MQSWPLERKIQVTQTRIIEWYQKFAGQVYVSFSGGKDSTVLLDIARRIYPDIEAVFINTGLEYPEVRQFALSKENVTELRPEMDFRTVIKTYGYPIASKQIARKISDARSGKDWAKKYVDGTATLKNGEPSHFCISERWKKLMEAPFMVSSSCCDVMKKKPAKAYQRRTGKLPIIATMACEGKQRENAWIKNGCNAFDSKNPKSQPMSFWTEQDVLTYLKEYDIPYASVYGDIVKDKSGKMRTTMCDRTGCVFCGFGCHLEKEPNCFQRLKVTHPKLWNYCMKPWDEGGLGMKKVLEFINVKIE